MTAPGKARCLLLLAKACAPSRNASSPPFSSTTRGACRRRALSCTSTRAVSSATATQAAQSDAPALHPAPVEMPSFFFCPALNLAGGVWAPYAMSKLMSSDYVAQKESMN